MTDREERILGGLKTGELIINKNGDAVCSTCGGNCGQCGLTMTVGNIHARMEHLVDSVYRKKDPYKTKIQSFWSKIFG